MFGNFFAQESIALLRSVASEGFILRHVIYGNVKCLYTGFGQGAGYISDTQPDNLFVRVRLLKCGYTPGNIRKQVRRLKFQVILIDSDHNPTSCIFISISLLNTIFK